MAIQHFLYVSNVYCSNLLVIPTAITENISFSLQSGQLNEYTERKDMSCDVICMALANVPVGEQRCRFLAVGLADNTVRIISLDPNVREF